MKKTYIQLITTIFSVTFTASVSFSGSLGATPDELGLSQGLHLGGSLGYDYAKIHNQFWDGSKAVNSHAIFNNNF